MKYISTKEAAEKWGVSIRNVQRLLSESRIEGAKRYGNYWMIPEGSEKPLDPRHAQKEHCGETPFFTLPRKCPVLMKTTIYCHAGEGDFTAKALESDTEAQALFASELAYFRGETEKAEALADELLQSCRRRDMQIGCGFILCLCAMYEGSAAKWSRARKAIAETKCDNEGEAAIRDFVIAAADSGLYDKSSFPEWLRDGCFDPLPFDCYPFAQVVYLKYLLLEKGDPDISFICGPLISQCRAEGAVLAEIYCRLITAVGFHDRGESRRAAEQIDAAIALALPDRLYAPLAEERSELGIMLDERLSLADKNAAKAVVRLHKRLMQGWTVVCKLVRGIKYASELTQREHHAAKLAAKGLSNAEIAERMGVSLNTVKRYIGGAISKTGAADRRELSAFIALEGETLP